ncbi:hypothetical protein GCM10009682_47070 [Luedemannella flava]|uniref:Glycerophosphoryl diester phosphodiesterase membrane domain-containing protein n=1 Tax=Luedemannella flava TaxID=349316 RepID=A0ABP4YQD1_9ACTN
MSATSDTTGLAGPASQLAPPTPELRSWWATTLSVTRRSWRPALLVTGVSISVPETALELARVLTEATGHHTANSLFDLATATSSPTAFMLGIVLPALLLIAGSVTATIGWAGGVWALVGPTVTGQPVSIADAYRYGLSRLTSLWPWTLAAAFLLIAGLYAFVVPGIYLLFALSMFSYAVLFEHSRNPLLRSLALTHTRPGRALARWAVVAAVVVAFEAALSLIFGALSLILFGHPGFGADGIGLQGALIDTIHTAFAAPTGALLVIGLTITYADLRTANRS